MNRKQVSAVAKDIIDGFDSGAHRLIGGWRDGGERLGQAARRRWDAALKESSPELSAETRRNAANARDFFGGCYTRGVELSADGAQVAVEKLVQAAREALERAQAWHEARDAQA